MKVKSSGDVFNLDVVANETCVSEILFSCQLRSVWRAIHAIEFMYLIF